MRLNKLLESTTLTIDDLLTKDEQHQVEKLVKSDKDTFEMERLARHRLREKGLNSVKNIHVFLKFVERLKDEHNPKRFDYTKNLPTQTTDGILKSREKELKRRQKLGLSPYTGD